MANLSESPIGADLNSRTVPKLIWSIIEQVWVDKGITFSQARPVGPITDPTIVWHIVRRLPGREGLERLKARHRITIPTIDGVTETDIWAQWHTTWYQFDIYHLSDPKVDELSLEFEELIFSMGSWLKKAGVIEFLFDEEVEDSLLQGSQKSVFVRSLRYMCILEVKHPIENPILQQAWIRLLTDRIYKEDIPVVRNLNSDQDLIPDTWPDTIFHVDKIPQGTLNASGDYLPNIDYVASEVDISGKAFIQWKKGMARPAPGSTYYITYSVFNEHRLLPVQTSSSKPIFIF